ncbi:cell division protein PerM [Actinacidiphila yanglinensis]|nr:DUF6350 family protein [Actinacidiphila yanglinensis]
MSEPLTASVSAPPPRWAALRVSGLATGAVAAGLGLGGIAAAVLLLWIGSPYPDSGLGGALHVGAGLWLLAQGADLVRTETLSGDPAPVDVAPLLLSALPAWLVFRGTAAAVAAAVDGKDADAPDGSGGSPGAGGREFAGGPDRAGGGGDPDGRLSGQARLHVALTVAGWVLAGYLTLAVIAVVYATGGTVHVDPLSALYVPVFAAAAAGCGAWAGCGRPGAERLPLGRVRSARVHRLHRAYAEEAGAALRAAALACGLLLAGGALIGAIALAWHGGAVGRSFQQLSGPLVGRVSVLLLAVGLVPNLVVWASAYALGVGFSVGAGSAVAPAGASGYLLLPGFPLLAALPHSGTCWVGWTTLALPVLAALGLAWCVGNDAWPVWSTVRVTAGATLFLGIGVAVLAAWSGGPIGLHRLADFGPRWWLAGAAATGWTLVIAVPAALVMRYHVAHPPHPWRALVGGMRVPRPRMPDVPWPRLRRSAVRPAGPDEPGGTVPAAPAGPPGYGGAGAAAPSAGFPLHGPGPAHSDPLPWPSPAPLPLFPPPLPDLPPSAPPTPPVSPAAPPTPIPPRPEEPPSEPPAGPPPEPAAEPPAGPPAEPPAELPTEPPVEALPEPPAPSDIAPKDVAPADGTPAKETAPAPEPPEEPA